MEDGERSAPPPEGLAAADRVLAALLQGPLPGEEREDGGALLTLDELAEAEELSLPLLQVIAREGLLLPRSPGPPPRYARADAEVVRSGLALVEAGLPLAELLELARRTDEALEQVADHAVELFLRFVRDPAQGTAADEDEATARVTTAFETMLPATSRLIGAHFRAVLLDRARQRLEREADEQGAGGSEDAA